MTRTWTSPKIIIENNLVSIDLVQIVLAPDDTLLESTEK